ncbi:MAG: thiamine phosphate synthase [Verrucomicrobiales bacterium]|nr:thiamine phosphate synthase [Verrucomicrobiales bacterium]
MKRLADCRLYTFIDSAYLHGREPVTLASMLCDGGADLIQLRAKDWPEERILRTAESLLPICEMNGVLLVINDHPSVARRIGAPLAHMGQEDFFQAGHRHVVDVIGDDGEHELGLGLSSHAPNEAERAIEAGAAYIAVGPVYATPTKPGRPAVSLSYVRWAAENLRGTTWFAIGGITLATLEDVLGAGATRICVVSAILDAANVVAACREFRAHLPA